MPLVPHPLDRPRASLPLETAPLGEGGQGVITRVPGAERLVYKEYVAHWAPRVDAAALADLIDFGRSLPPAERALLDHCAWPLARVVHNGAVTGFLMPEVPADLRVPIGGKNRLIELQYLTHTPNWAWKHLHQPDIAGRVEIARRAVELIGFFHGRGLILGDISSRNLLWRPGAPYRVHLLDCDGTRRHGSAPVLPQAHSPDWNDPLQRASGPDLDTDRYKTALLVGRVLTREKHLRPGDELAPFGPLEERLLRPLAELWKRAAGPVGTRPTVQEWAAALEGRKRIAIPRPVVVRVPEPVLPLAPLGEPARGAGRSTVPAPGPAPARAGRAAVPAPQPLRRQVPKPAPRPAPTPAPKIALEKKPAVPLPAPPAAPSTAPAAGSLGGRVVASAAYADQRAGPQRVPISDAQVAALIDALGAGRGRLAVKALAAALGEPEGRVPLLVSAACRLLNADDEPVLRLIDDRRTVEMDPLLLREQFLEEEG
ncbi:hypothetical protein [Actinomadura parmotrematis]|uniref:Alkaline phosphatase-like protein PglZ C-terminal domain-containing protein n=1 Tax=Actinomadura parmotrematis TaxID=2864039 RepID=A0ABS7FZF6_9ACTN|nr:hypothetical protein [Actinomadura parmotrematis]MBW8485530.1 hypothetical protein [Actinomadura parmotrematis]